MPPSPITITGDDLTVDDVAAIARRNAPVRLPGNTAFWERVEQSRALNQEIAESGQPVYGVTTGLGESQNVQLSPDKAAQLQRSLVDHLGAGMGPVLPRAEGRAVMLARLNALARGYSAVRPRLLTLLAELLNRDIVPCIPELGSVGASGDLIPSSYLAATLIGRRQVWYRGKTVEAAEALAAEGLEPLRLDPKEGLALVNGTAFMTGIAALVVRDAEELAQLADVCTALTTEVLGGHVEAFAPFIGRVKPHPGQVRSAARIFGLLRGSTLATATTHGAERPQDGVRTLTAPVQDRYSVRCAPQFIGALYDAVAWAGRVIEIELNSSNDNPLYDPAERRIYNGGNFSGGHIALVMDTVKNAMASVLDLLDRQLALIIDGKFSRGLPHNLAAPLPDGHPLAGTQHGIKALQLLASAVTAEALNLTMPMLAFSRSTAAHNQDKVSMGATASRRAYQIIGLARQLLAAHLLALCQAADLRGPQGLGATKAVYDAVRERVRLVEVDRELDADLRTVEDLIRSGTLLGAR